MFSSVFHWLVCYYADARYNFIVDHQPIGRLLFRQFCEVSPKYQRYNHFLDLIDKYEVLDWWILAA